MSFLQYFIPYYNVELATFCTYKLSSCKGVGARGIYLRKCRIWAWKQTKNIVLLINGISECLKPKVSFFFLINFCIGLTVTLAYFHSPVHCLNSSPTFGPLLKLTPPYIPVLSCACHVHLIYSSQAFIHIVQTDISGLFCPFKSFLF